MTALIALAVIAVLGIVVGVSIGLVRTRQRRQAVGLEPPPDAPRVTPAVRDDVAQHVAELERTLDEREAADIAAVEEELRRKVDDAVAGALLEEPPAPVVEPPVETPLVEPPVEAPVEPAPEVEEAPPAVEVKPRLRDRLTKARARLSGMIGSLTGRTKIDEATWDELEEALIAADVGIDPTMELLGTLRAQVTAGDIADGAQLLDALKAEMKQRLGGFDRTLHTAATKPSVWLFVGVNGVGKTTTIGKLAKLGTGVGQSVVMAAGDTFRAAAAEQLEMWAERAGADIVRGAEGADPSSVIFDAVESAAAKGADLVLADTAGRLHTKVNLMEELAKVRRVADKGAGTVTEVLLVVDATTGQNGLVQARQFTEAAELTGVVLTKLDGSAKGGIVYAIQAELGIPVKLVGLGEGADDLVPFDADEFVDALFEQTEED